MRAPVIDVHAHVVPEACLDLIAERAESRHFIGAMTDPDRRLADMDRAGIDIQVLSAWQGFFSQPPAIAAAFNTAIARYAAQRPTRFAALGVAPMAEPASAPAELARFASLGLKGVAIGSNVQGRGLDEAAFEPFFAAAEWLDCPIFIHPTSPLGVDRLRGYDLVNLVGFVTDTALAAARLALGGVLARHPGLRIYLAHGGGSMAWLRGRWDHGWRVRPSGEGAPPAPPSDYLKRLYVDSITHSAANLGVLLDWLGPERIMLGTDYPYDMGMPDAAAWITEKAALSEAERALILGGNARAFFAL